MLRAIANRIWLRAVLAWLVAASASPAAMLPAAMLPTAMQREKTLRESFAVSTIIVCRTSAEDGKPEAQRAAFWRTNLRPSRARVASVPPMNPQRHGGYA